MSHTRYKEGGSVRRWPGKGKGDMEDIEQTQGTENKTGGSPYVGNAVILSYALLKWGWLDDEL